MKTKSSVLFAALSILSAGNLLAQGTFAFSNGSQGIDAPVLDSTGIRLAGPNYRAELYGSTVPDSLAPALSYFSQQRIALPFMDGIYAGYFLTPDGVVIPGVPGLGWAWLQVRAWDARLGSSYEQVAALGVGGYGESSVFYAQGGDPVIPVPPRPLIGLESFTLRPVIPEPSTLALLALGGTALWWGVQRQRQRKP